jgi:hypothetical protein
MFKKPELLNKEAHKNAKISPLKNYKHARNVHLMIVTKDETAEAAKNYPIFFLKDSEGTLPFAVLGLKEKENLFVNSRSGEWAKEYYVPALIRCYPFALNKNEDNYSMVVDEGFDGYEGKEGERIMGDDSELSAFGKGALDFVEAVYRDLEGTKFLTKVLDELDLFKSIDANIESNGQKFSLAGLIQIDTDKVNALSDENLLKLAKTGALNLVYAHLASLSNFKNLASRV